MLMRPRSGLSALVAGSLVAAAIAGCGGSSSSKPLNYVTVEQGIATSILQEHHVYTLVACPHSIPGKSGYKFSCTADLKAGNYTLAVTEGANGRVTWTNKAAFLVLNSGDVEAAIVKSIKTQRKLTATASCPTPVLQKAGLKFTCTAKIGTKAYAFRVTETDGDGDVTFVGV